MRRRSGPSGSGTTHCLPSSGGKQPAAKDGKRLPTPAEVIARRRDAIALRRGYWSLLWRIIVIAAVCWLMFTQVFLLTQAQGNGMFPAVKDGDLVIAFRLQGAYAKDDVVVYTVDGQRRVGRVVARETDVITLDDSGTLLVNGTVQSGEILYPSYAKEGITYPGRLPDPNRGQPGSRPDPHGGCGGQGHHHSPQTGHITRRVNEAGLPNPQGRNP